MNFAIPSLDDSCLLAGTRSQYVTDKPHRCRVHLPLLHLLSENFHYDDVRPFIFSDCRQLGPLYNRNKTQQRQINDEILHVVGAILDNEKNIVMSLRAHQ